MRTRSTFEVMLRLGAASLMALAAAVILFQLRIGGVIATVSPSHGIHSGDVLGLLPAGAALWLVGPLGFGQVLRPVTGPGR